MRPFISRITRSRATCHVFLAVAIAVGAAWPYGTAGANTPAVAQTFEHLVGVADVTTGQLEQAIDEAMDDIRKVDDKMPDRVDQAETTDAKVDAIENRLTDMTGMDRSQIPGTDASAQEFESFLDNFRFLSEEARQAIEAALRLRALLRGLDTWKTLREAWASTYKDLTGREVARAPVRNVCSEDRVASSGAPVSTNAGGDDVPRTDITGNFTDNIGDLGATLDYRWDFGDSGSMSGGNVDFTASPGSAGYPAATSSLGVTAKYDFSGATKLALSYSYGDGEVDPDETVAVQFGCPPQGTDAKFPTVYGALSYNPDLLSGGTVKVKTKCHATETFDPDDPPDGIGFDRMSVRGGFACPPDLASQQQLSIDWQGTLANEGINVDPGSQNLTYLGVNTGWSSGYCISEWERYTLDRHQCSADLTDLRFDTWEIAQPRQVLPAIIETGSRDTVQMAQAPAARETARRIAQLPNDRYFHSTGSLRAGLDDQWGLKRIGFAAAPPDGSGSLWPRAATPVLVAVVDSGIDASHPDLAGALWANPKETGGNGKDDDGNGYVDDVSGWNFIDKSNNTWDNNGHGTFVAGIVAARTHDVIGIAGVNPWARILPVKVTDFDGKGDHLHVTAGIYYAAEMGARVINVSIGGRRLTLGEQYAIDFAVKEGALVVAAAGNTGIDIADFSPAAVEGAITVAATDDKDRKAGFSNFGAQIDIAAPGVDILSLRARQTDLMALFEKDYKRGSNIVGADRMYYRLSGTSFAAPYVAGVASLLFSIDPSLTPGQVKRMILQSARDIEIAGFDRLTGYGLLDARAALKADPHHFIDARITGVSAARKDGQLYVVPSGNASADRMKRAWIEIGKGNNPTEWTRGSEDTTKRVQAGPLALVPAKLFSPGLWTLRLVVEHEDGNRREARHELNLR